jgi:hypothetical protein
MINITNQSSEITPKKGDILGQKKDIQNKAVSALGE